MVRTPEQTGTFLDFVAHQRLYAYFHLLAHSALRRGEGLGRHWTDLDEDTGRLTATPWRLRPARTSRSCPACSGTPRSPSPRTPVPACCRRSPARPLRESAASYPRKIENSEKEQENGYEQNKEAGRDESLPASPEYAARDSNPGPAD